MSSSNVLALLDNSGFIVNGKPNLTKIKDTPKSKLMRFCEELSELTSYELIKPGASSYTHSASISLGAGRYPCASKSCRLEKAQQLAQFSAFYSDQVYVHNFFHNHVLHDDKGKEFKTDFKDDIAILSYLYPLLESGLITLVTYQNYCPHCMALSVIGDTMGDKFNEASRHLEELYLSEVQYSLENYYGTIGVKVTGPESLVPHTNSWTEIKKNDENYHQLRALVGQKNSEILLTTDQVREFELNKDEASRVIRSIAIELSGSHHLKSAYLSESDVEVGFLKRFTDSQAKIKRTNLMEKYLTCLVPFISNVDPSHLIKLRNNENDSFILFRQSLSKAIDEYKRSGESFTEYDAKTLFSDVIAPQISKLDLKFNSAKRSFAKDTRREILSWVGVISTGFYVGAFTSSILAGAATLAGAKIGAEFVKNVMAKSDAEEAIKGEEMYYLWKVKKMSE